MSCVCLPDGGQKRESGVEVELQAFWVMWCGCWKLDSSSLEEHQVLLTPELALQQQEIVFSIKYYWNLGLGQKFLFHHSVSFSCKCFNPPAQEKRLFTQRSPTAFQKWWPGAETPFLFLADLAALELRSTCLLRVKACWTIPSSPP